MFFADYYKQTKPGKTAYILMKLQRHFLLCCWLVNSYMSNTCSRKDANAEGSIQHQTSFCISRRLSCGKTPLLDANVSDIALLLLVHTFIFRCQKCRGTGETQTIRKTIIVFKLRCICYWSKRRMSNPNYTLNYSIYSFYSSFLHVTEYEK